MALQSVPGLWIPTIPDINNAAPTLLTSLIMDAASEKVAFIVPAPKTGNIRKPHFRTSTVTSATDLDLRIETLTAGLPSGTLWAANTNVTVASGSIVANTWITPSALTADAAVTRGQLIAVVFAPTGTPNYRISAVAMSGGIRVPYAALFTGTWAAQTMAPVLLLEYDDGSFAYVDQVFPISAINNQDISTATDPDELALRFAFPGPVRIGGFWLWSDLDGDADVVLYDASLSPLTTKSVLAANRPANTSGIFRYRFPAAQDFAANAVGYLSAKATTATSLRLYSLDVPNNTYFDQMSGGREFYYREAVAGVWDAALNTRRPLLGLDLDGIDDGAGGGSTTNIFMLSD